MDVGFAFLRSRLAIPAAPALAALLLIGSSGAALAVKAGPDTVQCNGKCEACAEFEVAGDGTKRCVKCGVAPQCLGGNDPGLSSDFTEMVDLHNKYRGGQCGSLTWSQELATAAQAWASQSPKRIRRGPSTPIADMAKASLGASLFQARAPSISVRRGQELQVPGSSLEQGRRPLRPPRMEGQQANRLRRRPLRK